MCQLNDSYEHVGFNNGREVVIGEVIVGTASELPSVTFFDGFELGISPALKNTDGLKPEGGLYSLVSVLLLVILLLSKCASKLEVEHHAYY